MLNKRLKALFIQVRWMCRSPKYQQVPKIDHKIKGAYYFNAAFGKYLFWTNTLTSGLLMGLGDFLQQEIEYNRHMLEKRYDWARIGRMTIVGLTMGPLNHYFYKYLDNFIPKRNLFSILRKILLDQLFMSPVCIATFFFGTGLLENKSVEEINNELNNKFVEVYLISSTGRQKTRTDESFPNAGNINFKLFVYTCQQIDWSIWPPTQFINFYFLPVQYQVLYINLVTMLYDIFLSYIKHREGAQKIRYGYYND